MKKDIVTVVMTAICAVVLSQAVFAAEEKPKETFILTKSDTDAHWTLGVIPASAAVSSKSYGVAGGVMADTVPAERLNVFMRADKMYYTKSSELNLASVYNLDAHVAINMLIVKRSVSERIHIKTTGQYSEYAKCELPVRNTLALRLGTMLNSYKIADSKTKGDFEKQNTLTYSGYAGLEWSYESFNQIAITGGVYEHTVKTKWYADVIKPVKDFKDKGEIKVGWRAGYINWYFWGFVGLQVQLGKNPAYGNNIQADAFITF